MGFQGNNFLCLASLLLTGLQISSVCSGRCSNFVSAPSILMRYAALTFSLSTYCSRNRAAVIAPAYLPPEFFISAIGLFSCCQYVLCIGSCHNLSPAEKYLHSAYKGTDLKLLHLRARAASWLVRLQVTSGISLQAELVHEK